MGSAAHREERFEYGFLPPNCPGAFIPNCLTPLLVESTLKSAVETVPGAVSCTFWLPGTFISHLQTADSVVPASSLWVHLPLTTQSFTHSLIHVFNRSLLSTYYVQGTVFNAEDTEQNGK